jgi:hypothetical protein
MKLDEIRGLKGKIVTFRLLPDAPGAPVVTGRVLGTIEAADGLVVTVEPNSSPGKRATIHHQHIVSATPA